MKYFIVPILVVLIIFNTAVFGCTVFKVTKGKQTFFCNNEDGRLAITRQTDDFQILANFSLLDPENSVVYPCYRYEAATDMIRSMDELSLDYLRSILSVVHVEGLASTVYSNIYDLNKGDIYFYYFHNFETPVKLNLNEELKKGERTIEMSTLFPRKVFAQIATEELSKGVDKLRKDLEECKKLK